MKKKLIRMGILAVVFVAAVIIISIVTNKGDADMTADMESATLPVVSFLTEGYDVNSLVGYTEDMDIAAMRDTITPLLADGKLNAKITDAGNVGRELSYEAYALNGTDKLYEGVASIADSSVVIELGPLLAKAQEAILKLKLHVDKKDVFYYTRVTKPEDLYMKECLDFVKEFHAKALNNEDGAFLSGYLEPNGESDNTTLHKVTIHSELTQVTWGKLAPKIVGEQGIYIKETNTAYTSVLLVYQVETTDAQGGKERYHVKEFFKVRVSREQLYLLDYDRTMDRLFDGDQNVISEKGINLGITSPEVPYMTNKDGTIVSFVQERELWNYNRENDEISLVFSFANSESKDPRNLYDQHEVKIISVEENGNTTFAIYGYMNRGSHEGESGIAIYYFRAAQSYVEEKAFIPSREPYGIVKNDLSKLVYYSQKSDVLYVMVEGTLYKVALQNDSRETLVKGLSEGQYVASEDGHLLAYQNNGGVDEASSVTVVNLATGEEQTVAAGEAECIKPLGFVDSDFVYGIAKTADKGKAVSGEWMLPMYKIEIRDKKGSVAKTYEVEQVYTSDVFITASMITLNRVTKADAVYTGIAADYITNNQKKEESNISLETFITEERETQIRIKYQDGIKDKTPKMLRPKQVLFENTTIVAFDVSNQKDRFYLYAKGKLAGIYDRAGYAIQSADETAGVVTTFGQNYVWEKNNRDLQYEIPELPEVAVAEGENTLAACIRVMVGREGAAINVMEAFAGGKAPMAVLEEGTGGSAMNLTGCTVDQLLYVINRGRPVLALTDDSNAILVVGYGESTVTYLDPSTGTRETVSAQALLERTAGSGNTFIGYVK